MQLRHRTPERRHERQRQRATLREAVEHLRLIEAPHVHGVVDHVGRRGVRRAEHRRLGRPDDRHHIEIQPGRGAPVQPQLVLARLTARSECGEVEEAERHGLLELVGVRTGQQHGRDVGLDRAHSTVARKALLQTSSHPLVQV